MASTPLALVHSNHHGHGVDIHWQYVVAYTAIGLLGWLVTAVLVLRHEQATKNKPIDADDKIMAVFTGAGTFVGWPFVLIGFGIWRIVERFVRPPVNMAKRDR